MKKNWNTIVLFSVDILFYIHKYTWPTQTYKNTCGFILMFWADVREVCKTCVH